MSYCRFSCDGFASDVYTFESCNGGFETYVAGNRITNLAEAPPLGTWSLDSSAEYERQWRARSDWMDKHAEREDIPEPHGLAHYVDKTAADCRARLLELRDAGLHVPQHALDALQAEVKV